MSLCPSFHPPIWFLSICLPACQHFCLSSSQHVNPICPPVSPSALLPLPDTDQILQIIYLISQLEMDACGKTISEEQTSRKKTCPVSNICLLFLRIGYCHRHLRIRLSIVFNVIIRVSFTLSVSLSLSFFLAKRRRDGRTYRHMDRQIDRQTDLKDRPTNGWTHRHKDSCQYIQNDGQIDRKMSG